MIGAIAGDIIGSRFEGHPAPPAGFELFHSHCRFTDDTVCSLTVADAILRRADFASTLPAFVRRHPDAGYGGMFINWAFADDAPAYGSWGNGAPMRVAAVGWLAPTEADADQLAAAQAAVSHDHPEAIKAAQAVARTILALRRGKTIGEVRAWITEAYDYNLRPEIVLKRGGFDVSAAGTVPPALTAAFEAKDWEDAVRISIGLGGDTDTLACIAGAVAEAIHGVPHDIAIRAREHLTEDLRQVLDRFEQRRTVD
ncbi:ADP-ribosylglycohydrolase family protein [Nitratireductor sp. GCM10026969]|uniref:ADP-ribosylglycohydrolase family protein n=1 Tax=Nitratireductor sp. GCM10026969 TaxID=3252645 RepID=UPI00361C04A7